jgi:hypothetical protein
MQDHLMKAFWLAFCVWLRTLHDGRPEATTFAEGQQALMLKLLARCGIVCTLLVVSLCAILIWGGWNATHQRLIIYVLAGVIAFYALTNLAIVLSFAVGGPVGRIDLEATRNGIKAGASKESSNAFVPTADPVVVREIRPDAEPDRGLPEAGPS